MSDERSNLEDLARELAEEVKGALGRFSEIDIEEIGRSASAEADRVGRWVAEMARSLRGQADVVRDASFGPAEPGAPASSHPAAGADPLRSAGPHPLDLPSADQGRALAALDSGRWRLEPGTSALGGRGEGPGPSDALGLVRELRARDWLTADGEITLAGRKALERWLDVADPA